MLEHSSRQKEIIKEKKIDAIMISTVWNSLFSAINHSSLNSDNKFNFVPFLFLVLLIILI